MTSLFRRLASPLRQSGVQVGTICNRWNTSLASLREASELQASFNTKRMDIRFGAGFSQADTLAEGITDVLSEALGQLRGAPPHLCQVMVSSSYLNSHLAPLFVQELLTAFGPAPHIIGGVVPGCIGGDQHSFKPKNKSISLILASLPGVDFMPFAVKSSSLPDIGEENWMSLVNPCERFKGQSLATIVLAMPEFVDEVEPFLFRLHTALPQNKLIGGIVGRSREDDCSENSIQPGIRGGLFLGTDTYHEGAVGLMMRGDFELDTLSMQACRGVGPVMKVTDTEDNTVLELDHLPALDKLQQVHSSLPRQDRSLPWKVGILESTSCQHKNMLCRNFEADHMQRGFSVSGGNLRVGSRVQMVLYDRRWSRRELRSGFRNYVLQEGETPTTPDDPLDGLTTQKVALVETETAGKQPSNTGAMVYTWINGSRTEAPSFSAAIPQVPLQGGFMQAAIGPIEQGGPSYLHMYGSSFGVFRSKTQDIKSEDVKDGVALVSDACENARDLIANNCAHLAASEKDGLVNT